MASEFTPRRLLLSLSLLLAPASAQAANDVSGVVLTSLSSASLSVSWTIPAAATPTIVLSGDAFASAISSTVGTLALSTASFTGLSGNTTYWFQVKNSTEGDSAYVSFNAGKSTSTLAVAPTAGGFTTVTISTVQAIWGTSGNGSGTLYQAILSSGSSPSTNGFSGNQSTSTLSSSVPFTSGLSVNTTYFVEVRAVNNNGVPTAYTSLGSVATLPNLPGSAAPSAIATGQITANWTNSANPQGTRYVAQISADSGFTAVVSSSNTANTSAVLTGLSPNTTYYMQVQALSFSGTASTFTALPSTSTLAAAPAAAPFSAVSSAAVQANWTSNGNGTGVRYEAVLSSGASPSTNGFTGNKSTTTSAVFAVFSSGLSVNTTYFADVRAINNNNVPTAYASLGSTPTLADAPSAAGPSAVTTGTLTANWGANGNPAGTRYLALISSDSFVTLANSSTTANSSATFSGLSPGTTYFTRVSALNFAGGASAQTILASTSTLAEAPGAAAFTQVSISSIQANWTTSGNGSATRYEAVLSTGPSPGANGFSGNKTLLTSSGLAMFTGLTLTTTYYAEVRAINANSVATSFTGLGSTRTLSSAAEVPADQPQALVFSGANGEISIGVPASTFEQSVSISALVPASFPAADSSLRSTGVGVEITVLPALQPVGPVDLAIGYPPSLLSNFDADKLFIARYDAGRAVWVPLVSTPDPAGSRVLAKVTHFSLFQLLQAASETDLSRVKVFPNPFRPSQGQAAVTISQLPARARLRLYTYLGRLVRELTANAAGMASWDGKSQSGSPASSGVYIMLVESGGAKKTVKLALER